ncbi:sensor histidine kinase [Streptomyces arboris]|nr:ATP-binding protein [Streptomyces arboris]
MLIRALTCLRVVQFALWGWVPFIGEGAGRYPPQVLGCYVLALLFSGVMFARALRSGVLPVRWVAADVALAAVYAVVVSRSYPPIEAASISNWVIPPLCGVTVTAAIYAGRYRVPAVIVVIAAWVAGAWPAIGTDSRLELLSNTAMMTLFALVAGITGKWLLGAAKSADEATERAVAAENAEARMQEAIRQKRLLHDHALATLLAIAQGTRTMGRDQIERLARKELEFLRTMADVKSNGSLIQLGESLAVMIRDHTAQVVLANVESVIAVPEDIPADVVAKMTSATCEALNNVVVHAETDWVRVTASSTPQGGVRITVVDRGRGFDPETVPRRGLDTSIAAPLREIDGEATIRSAPGNGTTVELKWSKR